ncbi:MAG TPA: methyltransferase domain-containing protein [Gaiellaceae bacterium]|nr:methyltransferase domain-containing protein [Gaiellaceae bacterium]
MSENEHAEATQARFAASADLMAEHEASRRDELRAQLRRFLEPTGEERVLDVGAGTGGFAFAVAPLVREVVAADVVPEVLDVGRAQAVNELSNVTFVEADGTRLPFEDGSFDLAASVRTLHHVARPELVVAELSRVIGIGGQVLIVDQIAPIDPLAGFELDRFERARDPSHTRLLPDTDIRALLDANGLVLRRSEQHAEARDVDRYLDLAGCAGAARERALSVAPQSYTATVGWYLAARQPLAV